MDDDDDEGRVVYSSEKKGRNRFYFEALARREQLLAHVQNGMPVKEACTAVGWKYDSYLKQRQKQPAWAASVDIARAGMAAVMTKWDGSHASFAKRYFGMGYARHQLEFINALEQLPLGNILLSLWPPEHGKTTTFENYASEKLGTDPTYRITVASEALKISRKILGRVKLRMEPEGPTPRYVRDFGPFKPPTGVTRDEAYSQPWGADYFNVFKKGHSDERDYSMQAVGYKSSVVSTRCDHLHMDDLQSTKTKNQTDEIEEYVRQDLLSRPGEHGIITGAGTRVGEDDIWARLADDEELEGILTVKKFAAIRTDAITGEQVALWPERYNLDQLDRMRRKVGEEAWSRNYMQNPSAGAKNRTFGDAVLDKCKNSLISLDHNPTEGAIGYAGLDPALGAFNCVMAAEVTPDNKLIIRDIKEVDGLSQNEEIMAELETVLRRFAYTGHITDVVVETMNFQKGLANDERFKELEVKWGFSKRPHLTGNNKYDEDIGIPSMVSSFIKGEIVLPWAPDTRTRYEIGELVRQLKAWKPGQRGSKFRMDRVMALWFIWILWRERYKSRALERGPAMFKRQGLPYPSIGSGLILPPGARRAS